MTDSGVTAESIQGDPEVFCHTERRKDIKVN